MQEGVRQEPDWPEVLAGLCSGELGSLTDAQRHVLMLFATGEREVFACFNQVTDDVESLVLMWEGGSLSIRPDGSYLCVENDELIEFVGGV